MSEQQSYITTPRQEQYRLSRQYRGRYEYTPDVFSAIAARAERGLRDSTTFVMGQLIQDKSASDGEQLSVDELYHKYPGLHWQEPLTEKQAAWRWRHHEVSRYLNQQIQRREQGVTASVAGFITEAGVGMLASPESYVAPFVGRLSTATARALSRGAAKSGIVSRGLALRAGRNRFLTGFAEDAALTATATQPLFATREEMAGNPQSALDYMANVAVSGLFSGVFNEGVGRVLDKVSLQREVEYRSRKLAELITGRPEAHLPPKLQEQVRKEAVFSSHIGQWRARNDFSGRVLVVDQPGSDFVSGRNPETGDITLNTAKIRSAGQLTRALDGAAVVVDIPTSTIGIDETGTFSTVETPKASSYEASSPEEQFAADMLEQAQSPHVQYNLSDPKPGILDISMRRMKEQIAGYENLDPRAGSVKYLSELFSATPRGTGFSIPPAVAPADPILVVATGQDIRTPRERYLDSVQEAVTNQARSRYQSRREAFLQHDKSGALMNAVETLSEKEFEKAAMGTDFSRNELLNTTPEELEAKLLDFYEDEYLNLFHTRVKQDEAVDFWSSVADRGYGHLQASFDGSLIRGVMDRFGHGDNPWRRQEVERSLYSNQLHTAFIEAGVDRFLRKYDDEAVRFFSDLDKFMKNPSNASPEVAKVGNILIPLMENQRVRLNNNGANIRKLDGFFLRTVHEPSKIAKAETQWFDFMLENLDWNHAALRSYDTPQSKRGYLRAVFEDIQSGHYRETDLDMEIHGGQKGKTFAHSRKLHFLEGQQSRYNDLFGRNTTARELLNQIELRGKAIAITDTLGPDFKKTWATIEQRLIESGKVSEIQIKRLKNQFDEITGEANIVADRSIASFGSAWRAYVGASTLHNSGITVAVSDVVSQIVNLRSSGLSKSLGAATWHVLSSYGDGIRAILRKNPTEAERRLSAFVLPFDSNLMAIRNILGDGSASLGSGTFERLSLATIKWSGTGFFTSLSQMTTAISTQRRLAHIINTGDASPDFAQFLDRFGITSGDLSDAAKYIEGDQLDIFNIEPRELRDRFHRLLSESISVGSLQTDPLQTSFTHGIPSLLGLSGKRGTIPREITDAATQFLPSAIAVHQRLLMRMAITGGGDARFRSLIHRSRIAETVTVAGMMLGSAVVIITVKDMLRNKEPAFLGDKSLDPEYLKRIVKVSGIAPLVMETLDTIKGGMLTQQLGQMMTTSEAALSGDFWETVHQGRRHSPFVATNIGPMPELLTSLIGLCSEEYLRDTLARQRTLRQMSGQDKLLDL